MFTFRQSTLGNTLANSTTAATIVARTTECLFALFLLSRCRVYKKREIRSVIGVRVSGRNVVSQDVGRSSLLCLVFE